jgi:toxin ParE1/3/4
MTRTLRITRAAEQDLFDAARYIAQDSPTAAGTLLNAFDHAYLSLLQFPDMGARRDFGNPELADLRFLPITGFEKYLIFYRATPDSLEIIRVIHGARDLPALFA